MKKFFLSLVIVLTVGAHLAHAQGPGIFGDGIELSTKQGAGLLTTTLYANNNSGTTRLLPTGSTATLDQTSFLTSPETGATFNLGNFNPAAGDTLTLTGFSLLTYGGTATSSFGNYRIDPSGSLGTFAGIGLPDNADNVSGNTGDTRWSTEALAVNLLTGLTNGTYTLGIYYSTTNGTFSYDGNNGANYGASFTVVPEPGAWVMLAGGLGVLALIRGRKLLAR